MTGREFFFLPRRSVEGYDIVYHRLHDAEPSKYFLEAGVKLLCMTVGEYRDFGLVNPRAEWNMNSSLATTSEGNIEMNAASWAYFTILKDIVVLNTY
ncbi:hypothetical protein EVAR_50781_1 [Eumeta japonica]|uniref:Uncharacterized protein n=1 Tax=Eumeta variegata TaxID=151549 RepID=A0A4C1WSL1_EUMVA|nr:hypothetical protein EVAR_50781_1 [Eumeta japonica]